MTSLLTDYLSLRLVCPHLCLFLVSLLKTSCIFALASGTARLLKSRSAAARSWIWRCAAIAFLASAAFDLAPGSIQRIRPTVAVRPEIPPVSFPGEREPLRTSAENIYWAAPPGDPRRSRPIEDRAQKIEEAPPGFVLPLQTIPWWTQLEAHLLQVWWAGAGVLIGLSIVRIGCATLWLRRTRRQASASASRIGRGIASSFQIRSSPDVWISSETRSPLILGIFRPTIYFPVDSSTWSAERFRSVFIHELSHWKRLDHWWGYVARLTRCIFWWNPLVALSRRQMSDEAELAADDQVLLREVEAVAYATTLVEIASSRVTTRQLGVGVAMVASDVLENRIRGLFVVNPWRGRIGLGGMALIAGLALILGVASAVYITQANGPTTSRDSANPEFVGAGRRQTVRLVFSKPEAKAVFLAGDFNNWNTTGIPMRRDWRGRWSVEVQLPAGSYQYKFVADGAWFADPANPNQAPNNFGTKNSRLEVRDIDVQSVDLERAEDSQAITALFENGDYATLDALATKLRVTKARFSDGTWRLVNFYDSLEPWRFFLAPEDWDGWFKKVNGWRRAFPQSITALLVEARGWELYADKGNPKEHALRRQKVKELLFAAAGWPNKCPRWYDMMIDAVAVPEQWPEDKFFSLIAEAVRYEPGYYDILFAASWYKLGCGGWYGKESPWFGNLERLSAELAPEEGSIPYARLVWSRWWWFGNIFEESPAEWSKVKKGFLELDKRYPDSRRNLNGFLQFALLARDKEMARELYQRIGENGDESWGAYSRYRLWRDWADPATPAWRTTPIVMTTRRTGWPCTIHSIAFSPDGKNLLSCAADETVTIWDAVTGARLWQTAFGDHPARSVAFSPDGRLFAAGGFQDNVEHERGLVRIWDRQSCKPIADVQPPTGNAFSITFTPDGRSLIIAGGDGPNKFTGYIWDLASQQLRRINFPGKESWAAQGVTVSPDSRTLIASCYQDIVFYSLADDRVFLDTEHRTHNYTKAAAFSPDGKLAVTAGTPPWRSALQPGNVTFWDTATSEEKTIRVDDGTGGLSTVSFSPDGKLIAGAGLDQTVHVWDAATAKSKAVFLGHDRAINAVAFSPDGKTVTSAGEDGVIKFWQMPQ